MNHVFSKASRRGIVTLVGLAMASTGLGVSPASAETAKATVDTSTIVFGAIDADADVSSVQAAGITTSGGKPIVRYVRHPARHWSPRKAKHVPFARSYWAGVRSGKPFRLHRGQRFPDTYIGMAEDMTEHDVAVNNKVKHAWQLFDFGHGEVRNRGFFNGHRWVGDCVNPKPSQTPTMDISQVKVVPVRGSLTAKIMGSLSLWGTTSGMVEVECGTSRARARYDAKAEANIEGSVFVKARTRAEAIAKGVEALTVKYRNSQEAELALRADAKIKLEGSAEAECEGTTQQPVTNAPAASATAEVCTTPGGVAPGTIQVFGKNNDDVARNLEFRLSGPSTKQPVTKLVNAGQTGQVTFSELALGNYTYTVTVTDTGKSDSGSVSLQPCPQPTMTLSLDKPNDVDQSVAAPGQPIDWSFTKTFGHSTAPSGAGDVTYTVRAKYGMVKFVTANSPCDTNGLRDNVVTTFTKPSGTYDLALCYIASTEDPASYGGHDDITLESVFAGKTYTVTQSITVNPTPTIPR